MLWLKLRASEWIVAGYFAYIAAISPWFRNRPHLGLQPVLLLAGVFALLSLLSRLEHVGRPGLIATIRDFVPVLLTLVAFREMELFLPAPYDLHLETVWAAWDRTLLGSFHLRAVIEGLGPLIPGYLELCYLLVYGLPFYCIGTLYACGERRSIDRFLVVYLTGTLAAYMLFPYFPSEPPRIAFPTVYPPQIVSVLRRFNLWILKEGTIHVGVFPSAHVSSAFAASWAMFLILPKRKAIAWVLLIYAASVSMATIYGRYHYAADVAAGFGISLAAALVAVWMANARTRVSSGPEMEAAAQTAPD